MSARDKAISLGLFVVAAMAWFGVAWVLTSVSPVGNTSVQLFGAVLLGTAVTLTACPLVWLGTAGRLSDSSPGSWATAGRRSGLIGLVVSVLVLLRVIDALAFPVLVFLLVTALLVEAAFTIRR